MWESGTCVADSAGGKVALHWRQHGRQWQCTGIALSPAADSMHDQGHCAGATALLERLVNPRLGTRTKDLERIDLDSLTPFRQAVVRHLALQVPPGKAISYGRLAECIGKPAAMRAVGSSMRSNNWPILIPCHRVVAAGGKLGGFQNGTRGGIARKQAMLEAEGVMVRAGYVMPEFLV